MRLSTDPRRVNDVTLVHAHVTNDESGPRRVRVANRLDGPAWFPRRRGVRAAGWDEGGFEGVFAAGETRALGYASPAPPADPPAEIAWTERASAGETADDRAGATAVVRRFGDPRPPRAAIPDRDGP
jgi:hypothetical protein